MAGILDWGAEILIGRIRQSRTMSVSGKDRDFWDKGVYLTREELGDDWPLTVDRVKLYCFYGWLLVEDEEGTYYWVNGGADLARTWFGVDAKDIRRIWRDDPKNPDLKVYIGPIFDRGRAICDEQGKR